MTRLRLHCSNCRHSELVGSEALVLRLRAAGLLKRASGEEIKDVEYLAALAQPLADSWPCRECGGVGLTVEISDGDDDDFDSGQPCAACGKVIPAERMELFPGTTLCTTCQSVVDRGGTPDTQEYCPRCGSLMQIRSARGSGVARYALVCPQCRR